MTVDEYFDRYTIINVIKAFHDEGRPS